MPMATARRWRECSTSCSHRGRDDPARRRGVRRNRSDRLAMGLRSAGRRGDTTSTIDPTIAARLAALEAKIAAQQVALEAERALRVDAEAERDRLREAYQALQLEVELAHRRLVVAKAERFDTTQLELEFAAKLAALGQLAGLVDDEDDRPNNSGPGDGKKKGTGGKRDLRKVPIGEDRLEITDPRYEG